MKKLNSLLTLLVVAVMAVFSSCDSSNKEKLNVLYVGGSANLETMGGVEVDPDTLAASVAERMASFSEFLNDHFTDVTVIDAKEYTPDMSKNFDVTVFDGRPNPIREKIMEYDENGRVTRYEPAAYLPDDFSSAALCIASASQDMGRTIGTKNDWYCLCLDNYAFGMNKDHEIFKGPFKVEMTTEMLPPPASVIETAPMQGIETPTELEMWKVVEYSYGDPEGKSKRIGMISRPGGYLDSPETEVISGGKSAKTIDAVAIGRHGNFFHWGFAADPKNLTPSAREALANAIVYAAKFNNQPIIARKKNEGIATRDHIQWKKWGVSKEAWQSSEETMMNWYLQMDSIYKLIDEKKANGEELDAALKMYAQMPAPVKPAPVAYVDYLKQREPALFAEFGEDLSKYNEYFDSNYGYFRPDGVRGYEFVIDEDVKAMGIANNDIKLLETAIAELEGENTDRAKRVLERYTLCRFATPAEWRAWFDKYKDQLFFTESGGYLWLVNSYDPDVVGNDYSILDKKIEKAAETTPARMVETTRDNPVAMAGSFDKAKNEIVLTMKIHEGFHIYATVDPSDPFVVTEISLTLPEGVKADGEMVKPQVKGTSNATSYYEGTVEFRQKVSGNIAGTAKWTVKFQCCDNQVCLTPETRMVDVTL
ncbi:MAG: protein-disulfide reductase DsbD N-terminal domain-containing protein [Muribaculaceae bacterium]|nr:protein-disulfide reductase DsbD N-terminal domain-containing protein [Muribaculaceae bacterium]